MIVCLCVLGALGGAFCAVLWWALQPMERDFE